jgi:hypothetical protein
MPGLAVAICACASMLFHPALAQVHLTEFSAANATGLADEEGDTEDWIEIANFGVTSVNLEGWHLTDDRNDRRKWTFPATPLPPNGYLVVFASGKDRRTPGLPLHANFRLSADGEYLALVLPDGVTIATEFAPAYPRQFRDVSFGFGLEQQSTVLVAQNALGRFHVPLDGNLGSAWTEPGFNDGSWRSVTNGVGYDTGQLDPAEGSYAARVQATDPALYWRLNEPSGLVAANLGSLADAGEGRYEGDPELGNAGPRPPAFSDFESDNRAPYLDGIDDFVGGPAGLLNDRAGFTMAGWIRPATLDANRTGLWGQNDAVEFGFISSSTLQLWTFFGSVDHFYPYPGQEWHHVIALGSETSLRLYLDGVLAAESGGGGGNYGSSPFAFNVGGGGVFDASGNAFSGQIDEVSVWTRALSTQEIDGLFQGTVAVDFGPHLATDVGGQLHNVNSTAYLRFPFDLGDPSTVSRLILRVRYDDGLAAWINGVQVAGLNAPEALAWNSVATQRHADHQAILWQELDLTSGLSALMPGTNCLAIQGLNIDPANTDFLLQAELSAVRDGAMTSAPRYFTFPTPGGPNGVGADDLGPIFHEAFHAPLEPADAEALTVMARLTPAFAPIASVQLHYRILFGVETTLTMNDAGTGGDAMAGDGLWTAVIPAQAAAAGQLIRYHVSALGTDGHGSRWPLYPDPLDSEAYLGTVVVDPSIQSALPVVHLFVENVGAADTFSGTRASLFHAGELYDNVHISLHGQSSSGFPKKSYNLDFTADHRFRYRPGETRVKDIRLMSNWGDKARVRNALAYDYIAEAGSMGHFAFQVRVQRNAQFFSIADMMEDGDDRWLERLGRDPNGALYKMYNNLGSAGGNEKKTRRWEDFSDLQALVNNLDEGRPLSQRALYAWDRLDLPQTVSYFVAMALSSSQDHGHKNYYVYCDNDGSGEWSILPWDVDLTWGRNWLDAQGYFTDTLFQDNVLSFYNSAQQGKPSNRLYNLIFQQPEFRAMFLRRLRTVMDTVLQPPGTPAADLRIEARVRQMMDAMDPPEIGQSDADLDYARWGTWGNGNAMRAEANRILSTHLPGRRTFLFTQNPQLNGENIPAAQPTDAAVRFGRIDFNPASGNQAEEFIELTNANAYAIDLSGWHLKGAVRHQFRPGTVIPAQRSLFLSPDVRAFRARSTAPRGGQGLFAQGNYEGQLNAWGETLTLIDSAGQTNATLQYPGDPSPAQRYLRITEIFYNPDPVPGLSFDAQQFEFLELKNTGPVTLDLAGVRLTEGAQFGFTGSGVTVLLPGASVLVVRDPVAFTARYGALSNVAGQFVGALDSSGENLRLEDGAGEKILEFEYNNSWYPVTDGLGFSLVVRDETASWDRWGDATHWRPSARFGGSPGTVDPSAPPAMRVVVNEILAHTDPPWVDAVELWNPTSMDVAIGGWYLTDDFFSPKKYRVPPGTVLGAGAYRVFTEAEFNPQPGVPPSFAFSSTGDEVFLFAGDAATQLVGTYHGFEFGASPNGVSFGRHVNSQGDELFVLASANTLGATNAPPLVGPVVFSEIMYHPPDLTGADNALDEYLELRNLTATNVPLYAPAHPTNTWRLRNAVEFNFPTGLTLPPHGHLLVVGFDPADAALLSAFRDRYQLSPTTPIFGPWKGKLDNSGEAIKLLRPDHPNSNAVPYILVEEIHYRDDVPWPASADGAGHALQRQPIAAFGNDPVHWFAAPPTPGAENTLNLPPAVVLSHPAAGSQYMRPIDLQLSATATDPDGQVTRVEFFNQGQKLGEALTMPYGFLWTDVPAGLHVLTARAHDDRLGFAVSPPVSIEVRSQPPNVSWVRPARNALVGVGIAVSLRADAVDPDGTVMQVEYFTDRQSLGLATQAPFEILWIPPQAGDYALTAVATDDSGATGTSVVQSVTAVPALEQSRILVPGGAAWRYLDTGVDPGPGWTAPGYDTTLWKLGNAKLGYGEGDEATVIGFGPNAAAKFITSWFRRSFVASDGPVITSAVLRIVRDDGFVAYLNGSEIRRDNLPDGPILPSTTALAAISGADESAWQSAPVPIELFQVGDNLIAVEMHQVNGTSSDLSFNAELEVIETIFAPAIRTQPTSQSGVAGASASFGVVAVGTPPLSYQWRFQGQAIAGATDPVLILENLLPDQAGAYQVNVSNLAGNVTSWDALLTVHTGDADGDGLPDDWESAHGLDPNDPTGANGADGDPDNDGSTNREEYQAGTDPRASTSVLQLAVVGLSADGGRLTLGFEAMAGRSYSLQTVPLFSGQPWGVADHIASASTNRLVTIDVLLGDPADRGFRLVTPAQP